MADDFFTERADQSEVKARIVMKYFITWAGIIGRRSRSDKIAYIDLYAGPGRYEDGSASTPLMVLTEVLNKPALQDVLVAIFNDKDENHTATLENEIAALRGINKLKHKPQVESAEVDEALAEYFKTAQLIPTFSFIDPFGYKGLSLELVSALVKDWGSDCLFFFNYSRINAGINNPLVTEHMEALFGKGNLRQLRERLQPGTAPREKVILEHLVRAMRDAGADHTFAFRFRDKGRTTHYLIFVSKHPLGYELIKEIMAPESSQEDQGVPSFEYWPAVQGSGNLFPQALNDLENSLVVEFAGKRISMADLYHQHSLGKPYIKKNYKDALLNLERDGRITANASKRKANTFADKVMVAFPVNPKPRP
jgi:three-Cys-motif partner protein